MNCLRGVDPDETILMSRNSGHSFSFSRCRMNRYESDARIPKYEMLPHSNLKLLQGLMSGSITTRQSSCSRIITSLASCKILPSHAGLVSIWILAITPVKYRSMDS